MKTTGLYGVGLLATVVALMVSCSDDAGTTNTTTGGTSTTAGTTSGGTTSAGTSSGGTNSGAGTNSTAGTTATAGTNNPPQGGEGNEPVAGAGNEPVGGAGNAGEECPATEPEDGSECDRPGGFQTPPCTYADVECRCQGQQQNREWNCNPALGQGGAGNLGDAECPADAMDGDPCTGMGLCAGQQCFCDGEETQCFGM